MSVSSSTNVAPGMRSRLYRAASMGTFWSRAACKMSVGAVIVGSAWRMSISAERAQKCRGRAGACRDRRAPHEVRLGRRIRRAARGIDLEPEAGSPVRFRIGNERFDGVAVEAKFVAVTLEKSRVAAIDDEGPYSFGVPGGKKRCSAAAGRDPEDHGAFGADGVEYGARVFDPIFHVDVLGSIGKTHAALVEQDESTERSQPSDEIVSRRVPPHVEMAYESGDAQHVDRSVADDLIRDVHTVSASRVANGRAEHAISDGDARRGRAAVHPVTGLAEYGALEALELAARFQPELFAEHPRARW